MKYFFISILCVFASLYVEAQSPQLKQKLQDAEYFYLNEDYEQAIKLFKDILKMDPKNYNVNYKIGVCYQSLPFEAGRSIPYLQKSIQGISKGYVEGSITEKKAPIEAMYLLAHAYHTNKYYDEAINYYQRYLDTIPATDLYNDEIAKRQLQSCRTAKEISKHPVPVEIFNVGNTINSQFDDFNPCPTSDGRILFFTRLVIITPKTKPGEEVAIKKIEKIMYSEYLGDDRWSEPKELNEQLKTGGFCNTVSINADGTFLILYKNNWDNGGMTDFNSGTLYYSTRKSRTDNWAPMKKFNKNINTPSNETHAMLSPDGKRLYVTTDIKGGYGGLDIYMSELVKGDWGPLKNLGPTVNTAFDEQTPIICEDGNTLYFSSEGHYNMGGLDIFKTTQLGNNTWSEPVNIGAPINSPDNNAYYFPFQNGKQAFYALARHEGYFTFGAMDIYQVEFIEEEPIVNEIPVTLQGAVTFDDNKISDSTVRITIINVATKDTIKNITPTEQGEYTLVVPSGEYQINFTRPKYNSVEKHVSIAKTTIEKTVTVNAIMYPEAVESKKYYVIRNIYFDLDSYELNKEAINEANKLLAIMLENPSLYIEVIGNTDSYGNAEYNQKLSENRSRKIIDYLNTRGIESERFISTAAGTTHKAIEDQSQDGKVDADKAKLNRRVEIRVLKSKGDAQIVVDNRPDELRFKEFNRFSVLVMESPTKVDLKSFTNLGANIKVMEFAQKTGGFLYYYGDYKSKADASKALNECIEKGYANAKMIDYFALNKSNEFVINNPVKFTKKYTIQLQAVNKPIILHVNPIMAETKRYQTADGYYRYTFREYDTIEEAQLDLKKIIDNGFTDAVIIEVSKLQK
jgi:outer membrane protein OmpA-like peptidoglycan-associated protein/tetratricopeptide (TPR) repeat protein